MKVISAAVGMYDIMERKVTLVEALEKKRAPFPDMGAIYILSPTQESVDKLLEDWASKSKVLYGNDVFLYFLGRIPEAMLDQIKRCKQLIKRLKALSEINIYFLAKEERAFMLDMRSSFRQFYLRSAPTTKELSIAEQLITVCATLNEYPYVRYRQSSGIASSLASLFHLKMEEFVASNPSWWFHGSGKSPNKLMERERSSILLLDRANDCLTPLMHDFTYQSMVQDLLNVQGDKITYKAETVDNPDVTEDKDVLLNDKDKLWVEIRGKHIAQVIEVLSQRIQSVVNSSTGNALGNKSSEGGQMSLSQMASALKDLPEYREIMSKLSQHMHLAHECMDSFSKDGLLELSDVEQTLATGEDGEGRNPKIAEMISKVESTMIRMRDSKARLRLLLIATISQDGLTGSDRDRLLRAANLAQDEVQTLNNLEQMGVSTIASISSASSGKMAGFFGG
jgi:syntaxin-binding protein 1